MKDMEKLYRTIAPKLTNWLVSSGSQYDVQSTFLKIWKMRDDVRDDADSVSGLAFTIARNLRKNMARDNSRLTFVGEIRDSDEGAVGDAEASAVGVTERLDTLPQHRETSQSDTEYLRKRLLEAFAKLPPILRDAVRARHRKSDRSERKSCKSAYFPRKREVEDNSRRFTCNLLARYV